MNKSLRNLIPIKIIKVIKLEKGCTSVRRDKSRQYMISDKRTVRVPPNGENNLSEKILGRKNNKMNRRDKIETKDKSTKDESLKNMKKK